jgi:cytoskeletal protein CcmA (bactofilin family)
MKWLDRIIKRVNVSSEIMKIDTLIGKRTVITGELTAAGNVKTDGIIEGNVKINGDLIVGEDAQINGDISAVNLIVAGAVTGNISAKGQLSLKETASVKGEHTAYSLIADEGSVLVGSCNILEKE